MSSIVDQACPLDCLTECVGRCSGFYPGSLDNVTVTLSESEGSFEILRSAQNDKGQIRVSIF